VSREKSSAATHKIDHDTDVVNSLTVEKCKGALFSGGTLDLWSAGVIVKKAQNVRVFYVSLLLATQIYLFSLSPFSLLYFEVRISLHHIDIIFPKIKQASPDSDFSFRALSFLPSHQKITNHRHHHFFLNYFKYLNNNNNNNIRE
jgi:hypothetical protein